MTLNSRSLKALNGVHPDLVAVVHKADEITELEFIITEGLRSVERQKMLVAKGLSQTMRSRHLTGHAIDFAPIIGGEVTWKTPAFLPIIAAFKTAGFTLHTQIESGGDWHSFQDYPHIQLPWKDYP